MKPRNIMRTYQYSALKCKQREGKGALTFLIFHAPAGEIAQWADVDRLSADNRKGAQRPLRDLKVRKIVRFLAGPDKSTLPNYMNTIPTSIIVALDDKFSSYSSHETKSGSPSSDCGTLEISTSLNSSGEEKKPGLIIDGQHRVHGVAKFDGSIHLSVVAFIGGGDDERAFQFIVINNSASRVPRDHIKALNLNFNKDKLNARLVQSAGMSLGLQEQLYEDLQVIDNSEPFRGVLDWPTNSAGFVPPNAIESALSEVRDRAAHLGIEDYERDVFLEIWTRIKHNLPKLWCQYRPATPSHLLQKVSIHTLTIYILRMMEAAQKQSDDPLDFVNQDTLHRCIDRAVSRIPHEFWTAEWQHKELDTSAGRQILLRSLEDIESNMKFGRPWHEGVPLVNAAKLSERSTPEATRSTRRRPVAKKGK